MNTSIDFIIGLMLIMMGAYMLVKKDGGLKDSAQRYTEASLKKYSIICGISGIVGGLLEIGIDQVKSGAIDIGINLNFGKEPLDTLVSSAPGLTVLVIITVLWFVMVKKKEE